MKKVLETASTAESLSFKPFDLETAFNNPFPNPKSANAIRVIIDEIDIQRPYRSAPKYFKVNGTVIRFILTDIILTNSELPAVKKILLYLSSEEPESVDIS